MDAKEKFEQYTEVCNKIGPMCDPIKEVYIIISRDNDTGYEGVFSFSENEKIPYHFQAAFSEKDQLPTIKRMIKEEFTKKVKPANITLTMKRFVLAEELEVLA